MNREALPVGSLVFSWFILLVCWWKPNPIPLACDCFAHPLVHMGTPLSAHLQLPSVFETVIFCKLTIFFTTFRILHCLAEKAELWYYKQISSFTNQFLHTVVSDSQSENTVSKLDKKITKEASVDASELQIYLATYLNHILHQFCTSYIHVTSIDWKVNYSHCCQ